MAGNNFNIPTFDIDLLNWSNNVKAQNAARARERQQDWNRVYDTAAALGKQIRAEEEAEKARREAAEQASIQRQFQAQEAEKARAFQAAQNAANRQAQEANANAMLNKSKLDNLGKAQGEIGVLDAELEKELGTTTNPADQALARKLHDAKVAQVYSRYGLDQPSGTPIPFKPVATSETPALAQTAPSETTLADSNVVVPLGLTDKQQAQADANYQKEAASVMENIRRMPNGTAKQNAMTEFNNTYGGNVKGYSTQDIKSAGFQIPQMAKGAIVPSDKIDYYKQWYKVGYDPVKRAQVIQGRK